MDKEQEDPNSHKATFWKSREGKWIKSTHPRQCPKNVSFHKQCQGILGHAGAHWCYGPDGSFHQQWDEGDPTAFRGMAASICSPDHEDYVHPRDMRHLRPGANKILEEITDPKEVARLERIELLPGEGMISPFNLENFPPERRKQLEEDLNMSEEDME